MTLALQVSSLVHHGVGFCLDGFGIKIDNVEKYLRDRSSL